MPSASRRSPAPVSPAPALPAPDLDRALSLVLELMAIPGPSGEEAAAAEFVRQRLLAAGAAPDAVVFDDAHTRTPLPGQCGNLLLHLPGTVPGPRRLLSAHLDTVPLCVGAQPRIENGRVRSANPTTGLGADNRAGCAVLLSAALELLERKLPHPPVTFCWFVQEEVGLHGARHLKKALLGKPKLCFNFDGGSPARVTLGATGGYRMEIEIEGLASHAGGAPEQGVSAIAIAGLAIADLVRGGWHGLIEKGKRRGTSNVGVIQAGAATNVVTDRALVRAEARSHDPAFRQKIVREIERAFQRAAREVRSAAGRRGRVTIRGRLDYESFRLPLDTPCVVQAQAAVAAAGRTPELVISNGGLDANWLTAHGFPAVSLGCGQVSVHTVSEALDIADFHDACRIGLLLATGQ